MGHEFCGKLQRCNDGNVEELRSDVFSSKGMIEKWNSNRGHHFQGSFLELRGAIMKAPTSGDPS
jgi:hypothetical protein